MPTPPAPCARQPPAARLVLPHLWLPFFKLGRRVKPYITRAGGKKREGFTHSRKKGCKGPSPFSGVPQLLLHSIQNPGNIGDTEMRVAIYCRVSTNNQELTQQEAACRRFCDYRVYKVAEVYQEIVSGAKAKRPDYQRLLDDLRNLKYDGVVVFRLDRLGRNARELALLVDELENKGVKVLSVHEILIPAPQWVEPCESSFTSSPS